MADSPFIRLGDSSSAPVLSYSLPEATSYAGRHYIRLDCPEVWFAQPQPGQPGTGTVATGPLTPDAVIGEVGISTIVEDLISADLATSRALESDFLAPPEPSSEHIETLRSRYESSIRREARLGNVPVLIENLYGDKDLAFAKLPSKPKGKFILVESYQLSSYLGDYGAGRTLNTFSLLPGEKTRITIRSYTKSKSLSKQASSVFDSFTRESAKQFEDTIKSEQSRKSENSESFAWHAEAKASASFFGVASASLSAGAKGASNSRRGEMAKNIKNATTKHAAKASAKRTVQVNTSSEEESEAGSETAIERELQNINLSRTLNFVFRQMNQEFITLLHLTDIRIAWYDGTPGSYEEVPVSELEEIVSRHVVSSQVDNARTAILSEIEYVIDHQGNWVKFIDERSVPPQSASPTFRYHAVAERKDTYQSHSGGLVIEVPGVIVSAQTNTLRTEGVIVEAILGQGEALDTYALGLQHEAVREKRLENDLRHAEIGKVEAMLDLVRENDSERVRLLRDLIKPCCTEGEPEPID